MSIWLAALLLLFSKLEESSSMCDTQHQKKKTYFTYFTLLCSAAAYHVVYDGSEHSLLSTRLTDYPSLFPLHALQHPSTVL